MFPIYWENQIFWWGFTDGRRCVLHPTYSLGGKKFYDDVFAYYNRGRLHMSIYLKQINVKSKNKVEDTLLALCHETPFAFPPKKNFCFFSPRKKFICINEVIRIIPLNCVPVASYIELSLYHIWIKDWKIQNLQPKNWKIKIEWFKFLICIQKYLQCLPHQRTNEMRNCGIWFNIQFAIHMIQDRKKPIEIVRRGIGICLNNRCTSKYKPVWKLFLIRHQQSRSKINSVSVCDCNICLSLRNQSQYLISFESATNIIELFYLNWKYLKVWMEMEAIVRFCQIIRIFFHAKSLCSKCGSLSFSVTFVIFSI